VPLVFPGTERSFRAATQFTHVPLLARAVRWMSTTPACENQSYNIVNGDAPTWSELWRTFGEFFGIAPGSPTPVRLGEYVQDKSPVWDALVRRHDLQPASLSSRVLWPYADYLFAPEWDIISSTSKARRDGFDECVDTAGAFVQIFEQFRREKIIP
jgi:nucleoside-diphosphate-sugar epimerase